MIPPRSALGAPPQGGAASGPAEPAPRRLLDGAAGFAALLCLALMGGCGKQSTQLGEGGSVVSGSAGPAGDQGAARELVRCEAPVATLALAENPNGYTVVSGAMLPPTPVPLVRLMAQQSGCFRVVDRSAGLRATVQEQQLKEAGILRQQGNTVAKGKGYEAQYTLTPSLNFSEQNAGRELGGLLALIPFLSSFVGVAENVKLKEAQVTLLLTDNETTEQLAAATGSVKVTDLGIGGLVLGKLGGAAGAGWSNSNEGKVVAAAFLDAHNRLVTQVRQLQAKALPPPVPSLGASKG